MHRLPDRIRLAVLPTPLERADGLSRLFGGPTIWVKRDDLAGFGLSGNKVRKLEFHLAAVLAGGADTVVTCGAAQSNHCRATALAGARLGLATHLVLRTADGRPPPSLSGNHLLQRLAGASVRFVDPDEYAAGNELLAEEAALLTARGHRVAVIPEGASDALGMWGFAAARAELEEQLASLPMAPAAVWHAASSGGTTAGLGWPGESLPLVACTVGETAGDLRARVERIWREAMAATGAHRPQPELEVVDDYVGLGYGQATADELALQVEATEVTGLLFDPTYTGKALYGLHREIARGRFSPDDHVVFWHTGGGFAVFAHDYGSVLQTSGYLKRSPSS